MGELMNLVPLNYHLILYHTYSHDLFTGWLISLPLLLCQPYVSHHVLTTFSCLAKQQNKMFLTNLEEHVPSIIGRYLLLYSSQRLVLIQKFADNLSEIQIVGVEDQFEGKKLIMNLFYWFDTLRWQQNASPQPDASVQNYLQQIISLKQHYVV